MLIDVPLWVINCRKQVGGQSNSGGRKRSQATDAAQNLEAFGLGQFVQRNECLALPTNKK